MGRLIDADALLENAKKYVYQSDMTTTIALGIAETWIKDAPTVDAMPTQRMKVSPLLFYLALYAPAPEYAPDDWVHHAEDNLAAWQRFVNEAQERGYYEFPIDDSTTCGPDYCEIGGET